MAFEDREKILERLREAASSDTDWSVWADWFVVWLLNHPGSETFRDFAEWLTPDYYEPDEYGSVNTWTFFFGYSDAEEFIETFFTDEEEAEDFRRFLKQKGVLED